MAESINGLEIKSQGLGACLKSNFLTVPKYQRAFSWEKENVLEFLTDINTAYTSGNAEYFMGSVVVQGEEQNYEVVDGQQRLTTASILIACIRDTLRVRSEGDVAASLQNEFLLTTDTWKQSSKPRLVLSVYDNSFYRASILGVGDSKSPPARESHERLEAAYQASKKFIDDFVAQTTNWLERLQGLVEYLTHKVKVIFVAVPSTTNAYVVFETLNDRGKDLSASDLLKNYLFGKSGERIDEVQANWNLMLGALELHGGDDLVITYIRQLWSATRGVVREKDLFSRIKEQINSSGAAVKFSEELQKYAKSYAAIFNANDSFWKAVGPESQAILKSLHLLRVERYRPAMLAIMCNFEGKELIRSMRVILNASVRYMIAIGAGGGTLEAAYSEAARKVFEGEISNAKGFAGELGKIVPNDETFKSSFSNARLSKAYLARYFLIALEKASLGKENCELVPSEDVADVNLEHVLPESPGESWAHIPDDVADAYVRRIGNMALLNSGKNSLIGNASFEAKKAVFATSAFSLTKEISACDVWGPEQVAKRQQKLAELAVKVWPFK